VKQAVAIALLLCVAPTLVEASTAKITGYEIVADRTIIEGIKPLKPQFLSNLGKPYTRQLLLDDVRRFQLIGTVGMVRTAQRPFKNGRKLMYRVESNPVIKSITFMGLTQFKPAEVTARFCSSPGKILDYTKLFADINTIPSMYLEKKGIMYADVTDLKDVAIRDGHVTITIREFKMGDLVIQGVKGPEADLVRRAFKLKKGDPIRRSALLASLCDIFQLSTVKDLDWYPRFNKERTSVSLVLQVVPAGSMRADSGARTRARGD